MSRIEPFTRTLFFARQNRAPDFRLIHVYTMSDSVCVCVCPDDDGGSDDWEANDPSDSIGPVFDGIRDSGQRKFEMDSITYWRNGWRVGLSASQTSISTKPTENHKQPINIAEKNVRLVVQHAISSTSSHPSRAEKLVIHNADMGRGCRVESRAFFCFLLCVCDQWRPSILSVYVCECDFRVCLAGRAFCPGASVHRSYRAKRSRHA